MNLADTAAKLQSGGARLVFDTNALFSERALLAVCSDVQRLNHGLVIGGKEPIELWVPAPAHTEKLFDLKQEFADGFDYGVILRILEGTGLRILPFDGKHALHTATRLGMCFPDVRAWRAAKRQRCLHCLGLPRELHDRATGSGATCGATIDWLIAGFASAEGAALVTDDDGPEFAGIAERLTLQTLRDALRHLLRGGGST